MTAKLQVMKFGGTSVGNGECIARAAEIIAAAARESGVVAVVSAMSGVTNRLVEAAQRSEQGDANAGNELADILRQQHSQAIETLIQREESRARLLEQTEQIIDELRGLCKGSSLLRELTPRTLDSISSVGERLSARLLAGALSELGLQAVAVEATEVIVPDNAHGQAEPLMNGTRVRASTRLKPLLNEGTIPVVTGFIGATATGTVTTLGRGGSDYSATILGAALEATDVIIWTDVDGVLTADP
ncbi:MAG: aspartate kinase, partial [Pyrinomonadaceae bacterium]